MTSTPLIDRQIAILDARIASVVDEVLHHPAFQALEARWRGLAFVVEHAAFEQNIRVSVCACPEEVLRDDLEEAPEITRSWLFRTVYAAEYGQFGGTPYGAIFVDISVTSSPRDVALLRRFAAVAAMAHAPSFFAAQPALLQLASFGELPTTTALADAFEGPSSIAWSSFRDTDDSRYLGVALPRILARAAYEEATGFVYRERAARHHERLWASPIFAIAARIADSFARTRSYLGMASGVEDRPPVVEVHPTLPETGAKAPLEVLLAPRIEGQLQELGFIVVGANRVTSNLSLRQVPSLQRPRTYGSSDGGSAATLSFLLGTRVPYIMLASRFAHYLKLIERERIGTNAARAEIEQDLNQWLLQFVVAVDGASPATRLRYPLRGGQVRLRDADGDPGWYFMDVKLMPHLRYMAQAFVISIAGKVAAR